MVCIPPRASKERAKQKRQAKHQKRKERTPSRVAGGQQTQTIEEKTLHKVADRQQTQALFDTLQPRIPEANTPKTTDAELQKFYEDIQVNW
ncbi:hypothetical protein TWF694_008343 [Orbilia ellipsospora]|uniref:Uncharacterized protein n=1 Tax=Orbilia ellipsospora TaxID=2528407 RepID=A0AAV9WVW5_9PEZI